MSPTVLLPNTVRKLLLAATTAVAITVTFRQTGDSEMMPTKYYEVDRTAIGHFGREFPLLRNEAATYPDLSNDILTAPEEPMELPVLMKVKIRVGKPTRLVLAPINNRAETL